MLGKKVITPSNGARAAIACNTEQQYSIHSASGKTENKRWFQASGTW